jgi:hypothetical protein
MSIRRLSVATEAAYSAAIYRIDGRPPIDMMVGVPSTAVVALMTRYGAISAVFVTACNPFGQVLPDEENENRQRALCAHVARLGLHALPGAGLDATGQWRPEASLFVLAATRDIADTLMRTFEQNAVVWVEEGDAPRLMLHPVFR